MDAIPNTPQELNAVAAMLWAWAVAFLPRLLGAVLIVIAGSFAARWAGRGVALLINSSGRVDETVTPVAAAIVRYGILVFVVILALDRLGVATSSLLAILGAAGLAIGLALQGTLTNIAAGLMLLWLRPFRVGDFIEVNNMAGRVREIGLFVCQLETYDGIFIMAPNSTIWNYALRNHSRNPSRLLTLAITLPGNADTGRARQILEDMAAGDGRIQKQPAPLAFVDSYADDTIVMILRLWANFTEFADIQRTLIETTRRQLEAAGIDILVPARIVRQVPPDTDPSRVIGTKTRQLRRRKG